MTLINKVIRSIRSPTVASAYKIHLDRKLGSRTVMSQTGPATKKQRMDVKVRPIAHRMYLYLQHLHRP
jgi:hypothetical protein